MTARTERRRLATGRKTRQIIRKRFWAFGRLVGTFRSPYFDISVQYSYDYEAAL